MSRTAVVVGAGPGIGRAAALKFAKEGYSVALVGRTKAKLDLIKGDIEKNGGKAESFAADSTDQKQVEAAFGQIKSTFGDPEVLVYNASGFVRGGILDLDPKVVENQWKISTLGALLASQQVLREMSKKKKGTIIFTGATASLRGGANFAGFAIGKWGLRALAQSIAREFQPQGIHVAHVIIDGGVGPDDATKLSPEAIADTYWFLHTQHHTAWTLELDLRPSPEKF